MKFMLIVKANADTEAGVMPTEQELLEMGRFNEELVNAGVMLAGEGLHPSSNGVRIAYDGDRRTVIDGPFSETKELIAGFWMIQAKSREEAIEWMKRAPFRDGQVEIRQVFDAADFGEAYTPEVAEQEDRLRTAIAGQHGAA
ncbi:YciI family protein [Brevundimonas sp.]|uniref:YciI family protein n=1 Tax=Brevundimonas sp. TaxID=1871086 RepID=UPI002D49AAF6|nr:YciI family protein [Brevundimonas sp.]HYD27890.1 YciI family protein [Brevundimonas sp.]